MLVLFSLLLIEPKPLKLHSIRTLAPLPLSTPSLPLPSPRPRATIYGVNVDSPLNTFCSDPRGLSWVFNKQGFPAVLLLVEFAYS